MNNLFKGLITTLTVIVFAANAQSPEQLVANYVGSYTGCKTSVSRVSGSKFRVSSCGKSRNITFSKKTRARMAKAMSNPSSNASLYSVCPQQAGAIQQLAAAKPSKVVYKDRVVEKVVVQKKQLPFFSVQDEQFADLGSNKNVRAATTAVIRGVTAVSVAGINAAASEQWGDDYVAGQAARRPNQIINNLSSSATGGSVGNINNSNTNSNTAYGGAGGQGGAGGAGGIGVGGTNINTNNNNNTNNPTTTINPPSDSNTDPDNGGWINDGSSDSNTNPSADAGGSDWVNDGGAAADDITGNADNSNTDDGAWGGGFNDFSDTGSVVEDNNFADNAGSDFGNGDDGNTNPDW
ncbi:hypothetical protein CSB11_01640 [Candidatus Campbellbacteria bacterium]|nr:MAG: hypothetical protein CSB11_01640 [Candidatus Campbellbacteria bacterium]